MSQTVPPVLLRKALAEFIGTALLVAVVVGSGIAAQTLSPNDVGLQLLENAVATAGGLAAIILAVGAVSGAHLNPVVSVVDAALGGLSRRELAVYVPAQVAGGTAGCIAANAMFAEPLVAWSTTERFAGHLWFAEVVATFGLVLLIFGLVRSGRAELAAFAVGAYIGGAYFFTASTSFANPAVTFGRMFSDTFAGIEPGSVLPYVLAQCLGAALALGTVVVLYPRIQQVADEVVVPHEPELRASPDGSPEPQVRSSAPTSAPSERTPS
jgi:glycerol uptake facilitator-like aquaporin